MYSPNHYRYSDQILLQEVITTNPFATLVSSDMTFSHLPIYLHGNKLIGHMAKANSHWQIASNNLVKIIFQGPHAYISPSWYVENMSNVPTWNYVSVHVSGNFRLIKEEGEALSSIEKQIELNEGIGGWRLPENRSAIDTLMKSISVFEITDLTFEGKFKLSQKHDEENKKRVVTKLESGNEEAKLVANYMKRLSF